LHLAMAVVKAGLEIPAPCKLLEIWLACAQSPLFAAAIPVRVALAWMRRWQLAFFVASVQRDNNGNAAL
jgi:hypothetical protein